MRMLRVTACELHDEPELFEEDWKALGEHVRRERSQLVVLPEMPFGVWCAVSDRFDPATWDEAVRAHEHWLTRLPDLSPATVVSSRPVTLDGRRLNEAFAWSAAEGFRPLHYKRFLPDEVGYWEAEWYEPGDEAFDVAEVASAAVGVLICTEMWSMGHAQRYGKAGAEIIVTPRATGRPTVEKWVTGGRVSAIVSGAFSVSSNRAAAPEGGDFGGGGWIINPDGMVLALTTASEPFVTDELDLDLATDAKRTYPRYAINRM